MTVDPCLITALVDHWRPETSTFHLSLGEVTITLKDGATLTGLPIDGDPFIVIYQMMSGWGCVRDC
ncbi:unnamed protein product [Linum tenue]|uniref:Aminotransferase-like plant mobile domain-containing protein n=1 Tax=Linum tenue TaxID=586396 RepID=A0AAV0R4H1_9ROSI|nr:unnamed protein product [Linum tenue]